MTEADVEARVEGFISRFADDVAAQLRAARATMRARLPGAVELVYDNYNALAIAYSASVRPSDIVFSIAGYPRWVSLFLVGGAQLEDPGGLLKGAGSRVRHVVLTDAARLDDAGVRRLMDQALLKAGVRLDDPQAGRTLVKSVSAKQRPRRPA